MFSLEHIIALNIPGFKKKPKAMVKVNREDLLEVLFYLWREEKQDFEEGGYDHYTEAFHIFHHLVTLARQASAPTEDWE